MPTVSANNRSSILWKNIVKSWTHLKKCICWIIGNDSSIRFWKDTFIPNLGPLINHSQGHIPDWQLDLPIVSFISNGAWNWNMFVEYLSPQGLAALSSIKPPENEAGSDSPAWFLSTSGEFSIKSACKYIMDLADPPPPLIRFLKKSGLERLGFFFSMGLSQWVRKNILDVSTSVVGTPWSYIFHGACGMLWKDRMISSSTSRTDLPGNLIFHIMSYARRIISSIAALPNLPTYLQK
ncbi:hypothetical protein SESBI_22321 [Sesbania bispinosa]|nr:hypothetical protein SESBI_22321 [Sesbania bispinosa]